MGHARLRIFVCLALWAWAAGTAAMGIGETRECQQGYEIAVGLFGLCSKFQLCSHARSDGYSVQMLITDARERDG